HRKQRALDAAARFEDCRVVGRAFDAPIGRVVFAVTVAIVLAVEPVVALDVAGDVGKREAVVRSRVVDRCPRPPRAAIEQIARARDARRDVAALAGIAAPVAAAAVATAVVPLGTARRIMAELVSARTDVPRLRDEFYGR